jgi:hypothetical protein
MKYIDQEFSAVLQKSPKKGGPGREIEGPLAVVILGGLVT